MGLHGWYTSVETEVTVTTVRIEMLRSLVYVQNIHWYGLVSRKDSVTCYQGWKKTRFLKTQLYSPTCYRNGNKYTKNQRWTSVQSSHGLRMNFSLSVLFGLGWVHPVRPRGNYPGHSTVCIVLKFTHHAEHRTCNIYHTVKVSACEGIDGYMYT